VPRPNAAAPKKGSVAVAAVPVPQGHAAESLSVVMVVSGEADPFHLSLRYSLIVEL
jgi:hypothetical protein